MQTTTPERLNVPTFRHMDTLVSGQLELGYQHQLINIKTYREDSWYERVANMMIDNHYSAIKNKILAHKSRINKNSMRMIVKLTEALDAVRYVNEESHYLNEIYLSLESTMNNFKDYLSPIEAFKDYIVQEKDAIKPTVSSLIKDLRQIDEFPNAKIDDDDGDFYIKYETDDITLYDNDNEIDVEFGPFEIDLNLEDFSYEVEAIEPNYGPGDGRYFHPHISDKELCEGEATPILKIAKKELRILDFLKTIELTLKTYNPGSPYQELSRWYHDANCQECGWGLDTEGDDFYTCEDCGSYSCESCQGEYHESCYQCYKNFCSGCADNNMIRCSNCENNFCSNCIERCSECGSYYCEDCMNTCKDCGEKICPECFYKCELCEEIFCNNCLTACLSCNKDICAECTSPTGDYCLDCNEEDKDE